MLRTTLKLMMTMAIVAFAATSCLDEEIEPKMAFSSNSIVENGSKAEITFMLNNGKNNWFGTGNAFYLKFSVDTKVRKVEVSGNGSNWITVDDDNAALFLKNEANLFITSNNVERPAALAAFNAFEVGNLVYVSDGKKFGVLRIDQGEYLKPLKAGTYPSGISCVDYLPFPKTYDFYGTGVFLGVTSDGRVAGSTSIDGTYHIPTGKSPSDVNSDNTKGTNGNVVCLKVDGFKFVKFTLKDGSTVTGSAQRGANEFIKVD